ncbi:MAG: hypothetical protein K2N55_02715 [Lachnospiraceae bacterium]|nr:hypothetical protein [Lachnospiraceae bacterium]
MLKSNRLRIEIQEPSEVMNFTSRFDPTCFITEVVLDQSMYFAASEPHNMTEDSSGGRGLCSEFRFDAFGEAAVGEWVPKPGIGRLKKVDEKDFVHSRKYIKEPFQHELVDLHDKRISFRTLPEECMGYAVETRRTAAVEENSLFMTIQLKNTGFKEITFREYCHNFISLDGLALGPDYLLELPNAINLQSNVLKGPDFGGTGSRHLYDVEEGAIRPRYHNPGPAVFELQEGDISRKVPFVWRLSHAGAGVSVTGTEYFRPAEVCIWSYDHMLCPEVNFKSTVAPGEEVVWKRQWTFDKKEVN